VAANLRQAGCHLPQPEGGFYLFPDFSDHQEMLHRRGIISSAQLCEFLLEEAGVACLPGTDFGRPATEFTIRLAYVDFDGGKAQQAASDTLVIDEKFLKQHCGRVLAATHRIVDWLQTP
jgi:aspartate aminotransferase